MSLKGVELQIALPKTVDAGKIAEQHQNNVINQQINANEALKKELERKQLTVNDTEPTENINKEGHNSSGNNHQQKDKKEKNETIDATHPFKGHFIDYSG